MKKREARFCRSLHFLRLLRIAHPIETSNPKPHAEYVMTSHHIPNKDDVSSHHRTAYRVDLYKHTHMAFLLLSFLTGFD